MALRVLHVDDSKIAGSFFEKKLKEVNAQLECKTFQNAADVIKTLENSSQEETGNVILFADYNMPRIHGLELLSWMKRHPRHHHTPVVLTSAEIDSHTIEEVEKQGAFDFLPKPIEAQHLAQIFEKFPKHQAEVAILQEIEKTFPEESEEILSQIRATLSAPSLDDSHYNTLYRALHTIKGNARSIQYPVLASFIHRAEDFLRAAKGLNLLSSERTKQVLNEILAYISTQIQKASGGSQMELPPEKLERDLLHFVELFSGHENPSTSTAKHTATPGEPLRQQALAPQPNSVRISNKQLDELQSHFKTVMQLRVKLSRFANNLRQEFHDEAFPLDLAKIVEALTQETTHITGFFMSLRVVPLQRLANFATMVVTQASRDLKKEVRLDLKIPDHSEIDKMVLETLEHSLTHLVRNCIDHGIEDSSTRKTRGKPAQGTVRLQVIDSQKDQLEVILEDDGRGLDLEKIKSKVLASGLMTEASLANLKQEQLNDLIFLDEISTKEGTTETSGRGVGMAAVKSMIEDMGGQIRVSSLSGRGTLFRITVPRYFSL